MHLIYHPEAEWELIEAAKFYERRVPFLGGQFLNAADDAAVMILRAPHRWSVLEEGIRLYHMKRFPYAVYYRVFPDHVRILAFKHHSRDPDHWRHRIAPWST